MTHLIVEELESRHLLSASALALVPQVPPAVPGGAAKVGEADHLDRCVLLLVPGTECQVIMDRHLPANAPGWPGITAREEAGLLRTADAPSEFGDHLGPQSPGPQETGPDSQGARMAGPKPDLPRPALPQVGIPPVPERMDQRPAWPSVPHILEGAGRPHELFEYRGVIGSHDNAPEPHAPVHRSPIIGSDEPEGRTVVARHEPDEAPGPLPGPQGSEALAALPPVRLSALEAAMRRFLAQLDSRNIDAAAPKTEEALWLWALASGTLLAACETARRQFWRGATAPESGEHPLAILSPIDPHGD
jgi:hypothetical protein